MQIAATLLLLVICTLGCKSYDDLDPFPCARDQTCPDGYDCDSVNDVCVHVDAECATLDCVGCADGTREGLRVVSAFPDIAGCMGGWTSPGVRQRPRPICGRASGNSGSNRYGEGCSAGDLCASGWHVCDSASDVARVSPNGCGSDAIALWDILPDEPAEVFYATGQSTRTFGCEGKASESDPIALWGCGGTRPSGSDTTCAPLVSHVQCNSDPRWVWDFNCPEDSTGQYLEATATVVKEFDIYGGVLCCRD